MVCAVGSKVPDLPPVSWARDLSGRVRKQNPSFWVWKQELLVLALLTMMVSQVAAPHLLKTSRAGADLPTGKSAWQQALPKEGPSPYSPKSCIIPPTPLILRITVSLLKTPPNLLHWDQVRNKGITTTISS